MPIQNNIQNRFKVLTLLITKHQLFKNRMDAYDGVYILLLHNFLDDSTLLDLGSRH